MDFSNFLQTTHPLTKKGTHLKVGDRHYDFTMNVAGDYVAEVLNQADRIAILSISAGYRQYQPTDAARDAIMRQRAGTPGVDSGSLSTQAKAKDDRNRVAGQAAKDSVSKPPKAVVAA